MSEPSLIDRARAAVHAAAMDPYEHVLLVHEIAKAISDAQNASVLETFRMLSRNPTIDIGALAHPDFGVGDAIVNPRRPNDPVMTVTGYDGATHTVYWTVPGDPPLNGGGRASLYERAAP